MVVSSFADRRWIRLYETLRDTRARYAVLLTESRTHGGPKFHDLHISTVQSRTRRDCALKPSLALSLSSSSSSSGGTNRCTTQRRVTSSAGVRDVMTTQRLLSLLFLVSVIRCADARYVLTGKCLFCVCVLFR